MVMIMSIKSGELSEHEMREAIAARDKAYDDVFIFGVTTTGIYCKPSCSSRAARAENLRFFSNAGAAQLAGYRPCKRCTPDQQDPKLAQMISIAKFIEQNADEQLSMGALAKQANLSTSQLTRTFKRVFGLSPKAYHDDCRLKRLKAKLKAGEPVADAIFAAGFGSTSRVYGEASRNIGMTPSAYRGGGKGEIIYYASRVTELGELLIAATGRGVCFVQFGDAQSALLADLESEFPNASLVESQNGDSDEFMAWVEAIEQHLNDELPRPDLPLDLRGTAFQIKVWQFLIATKPGDVVSYKELANGIGKPKAIRAAASACASNNIAVLIPCHRVLKSDGQLGGYKWGVARKRALLDRERRHKTQGK